MFLFWLAESAIRFTLLVAVTAVVLQVLRVKSADTQLRVWALVLLAALTLPFAPPQWVVPVDMSVVAPIADFQLPIQVADSPIRDYQSAIPDSRFKIIDSQWPVVLYLAMSFFLLSRLVVGWVWAVRLRQSARAVDGHTFFESDRIEVPVTVGLFQPTVLVPSAWRTWQSDTLAAVLAHEGDHAARRDGLWLTLGLFHRAIHWMNPLSWWLCRHLVRLSERASDDAALMEGVAPARYAEVLLGFAAIVSSQQRRVSWVVPMARFGAPDTEQRLTRVLSWKGRASMTRTRLMVLALILVIGSAAVYTATVSSLSTFRSTDEPLNLFTPTLFPAEGYPQELDRKYPVILTRVQPKYTPEALRRKIQGIVELEVEVGDLGQVTSAKVKKSLDTEYGLDDAAIEAVKQWYFLPRTVNGKPVASTVVVQMEFLTHQEGDPDQPRVQDDVQAPAVLKRVDPKYTPEAMRAKIQGKVRLEATVNTRGQVTNARIIESLDAELGLDASALTAASQWQYEPARYKGKPVASRVVIEMEFRLH